MALVRPISPRHDDPLPYPFLNARRPRSLVGKLGPSAVASSSRMEGEVLCMHCKHEIWPDRDGFWVHLDGGFKCRVAGVVLSTFAEPPRPPSWPLNATARDDGD